MWKVSYSVCLQTCVKRIIKDGLGRNDVCLLAYFSSYAGWGWTDMAYFQKNLKNARPLDGTHKGFTLPWLEGWRKKEDTWEVNSAEKANVECQLEEKLNIQSGKGKINTEVPPKHMHKYFTHTFTD